MLITFLYLYIRESSVPARDTEGVYPCLQLVATDVFVGTYYSNIGSLVMQLTDGLRKDKTSAISLDLPWVSNRQRSLVMD